MDLECNNFRSSMPPIIKKYLMDKTMRGQKMRYYNGKKDKLLHKKPSVFLKQTFLINVNCSRDIYHWLRKLDYQDTKKSVLG